MRTNGTSQNVLPVDEATVQERQVTVQVLTIGTKQITQALYKQLVVESVIDWKTGLLKGKIWGWVNLHGESLTHILKCEENNYHYHVIWEDNGKLKRCPVEKRELGHYKTTVDDFIWSSPNCKNSWQAIQDSGQLFIAVSGVWK